MIHPANKESGNVFLFIFMGIILFGALIFTMNRSGTGNMSAISKAQIKLATDEILNYGQVMDRTVNKLISNGCSESQISFNNTVVSGYSTTAAPVDGSCEVFGPNGGKLNYNAPNPIWLDSSLSAQASYGEWFYTGYVVVDGFGTHFTSPYNAVLLMVLPYLKKEVCMELNDRLGLEPPASDTPVEDNGTAAAYVSGKFDGGYLLAGAANNIDGWATPGCGCNFLFKVPQGCTLTADNRYVYYKVLIER